MRSGRGAAAFFDHIDHFCTAQELGGLPGTTAELHQPDLFASVSPSSVGINSHVDSGCSGGDLLLPRNSMIRSCKNSRPARGSGFSSLGTTRTAFIPEAADADEQAPEPDVPDDGLPKKGSLSKKTPPPPVFGMTEQGDKCQCNLHDTDGALTAHTAKSKDFEMRMKEASKDSTAEKAKAKADTFRRNLNFYKEAKAELDAAYTTYKDKQEGLQDAYAHLRQMHTKSCTPLQDAYEVELDCSRKYRKAVDQYFARGMPPTCKYGVVPMIKPFAVDVNLAKQQHELKGIAGFLGRWFF